MSVERRRKLSRFAAVAVIGGFAGACSSDTMRLSGSPFSNPFASKGRGSEPTMTGSIPAAPRSAVQSQPLPPPRQTAAPAYNAYTPPKPASAYAPSTPARAVASPAPSQPVTSSGPGGWTAQGGTVVIIAAGETLNTVANRYGVPTSAILSANGLRSAAQAGPGQQVIIPVYNAGGVQTAAAPALPAPKRLDTATFGQGRQADAGRPGQALAKPEPVKMQAIPEPQKFAKAEVQPVPQPKASVPVRSEPAPVKEPEQTASLPSAGSTDFRWPARGRVISGFGSAGNEGINIAVPEGTPVKAAESGTVAYAGSEVKGYGNLVLIRHDNGYVSAYAHNGEIAVKRGDKVKRGQVVAKSGQSGNVTSPQLHFEIRKGSTPIDPVPFLDN
jgi:murein DD-endopeptidase MepM/ murein hydrolase activator NlpD